MGRPRKSAPSGENQTSSLVGTRTPASNPATPRSTPSSARAKTGATAVSAGMPKARSAPAAMGEAAVGKETVQSVRSTKAAPCYYPTQSNIGRGDLNNNQQRSARVPASEGAKTRVRADHVTKTASSQRASREAQSELRSCSTRPSSEKMSSRDGAQGESYGISLKSLGKAILEIEQETRGQRDNPKWHDWRENRITASQAHKIANSKFVNGKSSEVPQSYLKGVVSQSSGIQTPAMSWGIRNEKRAVHEYQQLKSRNSSGGVEVEDCGLFIHPEKSWLAASPDGIVKDRSTGKSDRLLEVKCPYKHKDNTVKDACKDDKFCLTSDGDSYSLKKDHAYYTQLQCQMAATGLKKADFVVHTNKETVITPVEFDAKFWEKTEPKLEKFYNEAVVPHLEKMNPVWANEE